MTNLSVLDLATIKVFNIQEYFKRIFKRTRCLRCTMTFLIVSRVHVVEMHEAKLECNY